VQWNGRTDDGRQVAAGLYLYRLQAAGREVTKKTVVVR
jgi:hypothetical protein